MKRASFFLLAGLACAAASAQSLYRWVDETGRVRYSDRPPPASAKGVESKALGTPRAPSSNEPYQLQQARRANPVTLYTAPDCGEGCNEARNYLNARGVPFAEVSVTDSARLEDLKKVSGAASVPVLIVGKAIHKGFETGLYERALDAGGYPAKGLLPPRRQAAPQPAPEAKDASAAAPAEPAAPEAPRGPYAPRFSEKPAAASQSGN